MRHVMDNAEESVRRVIGRIGDGAFDYVMDDGAPLRVAVTVDRAARRRTVDFTGTGPQIAGQLQRAASGHARGGALRVPLPGRRGHPAERRLPEADHAADPAGHVPVAGAGRRGSGGQHRGEPGRLQRAVRRARPARLQPGDDEQRPVRRRTRQYYETICGGMGAGPEGDGASAIQTHMTNTRMTDPEVFELRYPVRAGGVLDPARVRRRWAVHGAAMARCGGSASEEPMTMVVVASRREVAPFGLDGGADGAAGRQWVERAGGGVEVMSGGSRAELRPGDVFVIETPGGGGFGA